MNLYCTHKLLRPLIVVILFDILSKRTSLIIQAFLKSNTTENMKTAFILLTTASMALAKSTAAVVNRCSFDVYLWSVGGDGSSSSMFTLPGGKPEIGYKEHFRSLSSGGVSLKVAPYHFNGAVPITPANVTQFEYMYDAKNNAFPFVWYDISFVNGNAFKAVSTTLYPSITTCRGAISNATFEDGYHFWNDDAPNMRDCDPTTDLLYTLCADGTDGHGIPVAKGNVNAADFAKKAKREADSMAICVEKDGMVGYCGDQPLPSSTRSPQSVPTTLAPKPLVALQHSATSAQDSAKATQTPISPPNNSNIQTGALDAPRLRTIEACGVTTWLSIEKGNSKRDEINPIVQGRRSHLHSHMHRGSHGQ